MKLKMSKRKLIIIAVSLTIVIAAAIVIPIVITLNNRSDGHDHIYSTDWSSNSEKHYHACTVAGCDSVKDSSEHRYGEWETVTEATADAQGSEKRTCSVCNYEDTRETDKLAVTTHSHAWGDWTVTKNPDLAADGVATRTCSGDGSCNAPKEEKEHTIPKLADASTEDTDYADYKISAVTEATCAAEGKIEYTYTFKYDNEEVTVKFDVTTPVNPSAHDYGEYTYTDAEGHYKICKNKASHVTNNEPHDHIGALGACSDCGFRDISREGRELSPTCTSTKFIAGGATPEYLIYGYTLAPEYHTYTYDGEKPITVTYRYYRLGDKTETTKTVTLSHDTKRSFSAFIEVKATCFITVTSDEETAFEGTLRLSYHGPVNPDRIEKFELDKSTMVDTTFDGINYEFTAPEAGTYVLTCYSDNAKVLHKTEALSTPYTFTLEKGEIIAFIMCSVDDEGTYDAIISAYTECQHTYTEEVVPPTCTAQGYTKHTCGKCGNTYNDEYIKKSEHMYEVIETKAATCTESGWTKSKCSACPATKEEPITAKGHNTDGVEWETETAATCTEEGLEKLCCKVCEAVVRTQVLEVNPNAHSYDEYVNTDATGHYKVCAYDNTHTTTKVGHDEAGEHDSCTVCRYMPAHTHSWSAWTVATKPNGETEGKATRTCTNDTGICNATVADTEYTLPVLDSNDYTKSADTATCSAVGIITYTYDIDAESVSFDIDTPINPSKHNYGDYVTTDAAGHYKLCSYNNAHVRKDEGSHDTDGEHGSCDECGYMPAHTHTWSAWTVTKKPTGETEGKATRTCNDIGICDATTADKEKTLPVLGSTDYTATADTATCIAEGIINYTYAIGDESVSFDIDTLVNPDAHSYGEYVTTDATGHYKLCAHDSTHVRKDEGSHDTDGEHSSCGECGYMPKHSHTWSEWTVTETPNETEGGKATRTCNDIGICNAKTEDKEKSLPILSSTDYEKSTVPATCIAAGKTDYSYTFEYNGEDVTVSFEIAIAVNPDAHNYSYQSDDTWHYQVCSHDSTHTTTQVEHDTSGEHGSCSVCGHMPGHNHTWSEWTVVITPTGETAGKATRTCTNDTGICGAVITLKEHTLPALDSTDYTGTPDTATCSAVGEITYTYNKNGVNVSFVVDTPVKPSAHNYGSYTYTDGTGHYRVCSYDNTHTTTKLGHDEDGAHHSCSACGYMPAHTHTWGAWTVATKPTGETEGKATRTCSSEVGVCEATAADKEKTLPVLGSTDYTATADTATCSKTGKITYTFTFVCDGDNVTLSFDVATPVNPSAHAYGDYIKTDAAGHYKVCSYDSTHTTGVEGHDQSGEHKSCGECGYMPAHTHTWSEWTVATKPNGETEGKATRTCTNDTGICNAKTSDKEKSLPVLSSGDYTSTTDSATCSAAGKITYTYAIGSESVSFDIETPVNPSKHNYGEYVNTDAAGHYKVCSYDNTHTTSAVGHDESGAHHSCSVCGYMPAHTHTFSAWTVTKKPTGATEGKATRTCNDIGICDATTADKEKTLPVLGSSDYTATDDTATCTTAGKITYTYNKDGVNVSFDVSTPANNNHDYDYGNYSYTDGTGHYVECKRDKEHTTGFAEHDTNGDYGACSVCGYKDPARKELSPSNTAVTFNVGGGASASVYGCNADTPAYNVYMYKGETPITISYKVWGTNETKEVTLSRDGGRSFSVYLGAKGMCVMTVTSAAATEFEATLNLLYCGSLDPNRTETFTAGTNATVETIYDGVKYEFTAPKKSYYTLTSYGNSARALLVMADGSTEALTLPYKFWLDNGAKVAFMMCSTGDEATYDAIVSITACETHVYTTTTVQPTCTSKGYTEHTCQYCDHTYKDAYVDEIPHDYVYNVNTQPTCTNKGNRTGECSVCHKIVEEEMDMIDHRTEGAEWQTVRAATCTKEGQAKLCCLDCGNVVETQVIPVNPNAHSYVLTATVKPTSSTVGTAQWICSYDDEGHKGTTVELPVLSSDRYTVTQNDKFITYTIEIDGETVSFSVEKIADNSVSTAIEYALSTSSMIVSSNINFVVNDKFDPANVVIFYEFGDNYVHAVDGYMNTERWITKRQDGTLFALIAKEDREDKQQVMRDTSASLNDFKGYGFRFIYAQQTWEMPEVYGLAQFIDVLYRFASDTNNPNSLNFTQSKDTLNGKTYYKFSYGFIDPDPNGNTDMNHTVSVEFTLNSDYFIDYCKLTGISRRGKTYGTGEQLANQTLTITQRSRLGSGEAAPTNPYNEDELLAMTSYKLQRVEVDEGLNVTSYGSYLEEGRIYGSIGLQLVLLVTDYEPTEGVNFFYDEVKVYLRARGDNGMGEELDAGYEEGEDGHVLASYDPITRLVSLGFWLPGEYELVFRTVKTEKVYWFEMSPRLPSGFDAYVYDYDELSGEGKWRADKEEYTVCAGQTLAFYASVAHPKYERPEYTVETLKDLEPVNGVLTTGEKDGKEVYFFNTDTLGTYTINFATEYGNFEDSIVIHVIAAPSEDYFDGQFVNDYKEITVDFDMNSGRYTLTAGSNTAVYAYTVNGKTITSTYISGTQTEHMLYLSEAYELMIKRGEDRAILHKVGLSNAIVGTWYLPTELLKVNITGNYDFDFSISSYTKETENGTIWFIGYSVDGGDSIGVDGPFTLELKSGQTIQFAVEGYAVMNISMNAPVESVTLDKTSETLNVGESVQLTATVKPVNATNKAVIWSSSDESVATVDANGNVTAIDDGTATITVTTVDGAKKDYCQITVNRIRVTGVTIDKATHSMYMNETLTLTATVSPSDATDSQVIWSTSAASVATVENGVVTPRGTGTATITVTTVDGSFSASCKVTVLGVELVSVDLTTSIELTLGGDCRLVPTFTPSNASYGSVSWTSSNPAVASVDNDGIVTAAGIGTATITLTVTTATKTFTKPCAVTVTGVSVTGVSLNKTTESLSVGKELQLIATVSPANATNKAVSWSSSSQSVATVDNNGKVTAVAAGNTTITVTTSDGSKTATCRITVTDTPLYGVGEYTFYSSDIPSDRTITFVLDGRKGNTYNIGFNAVDSGGWPVNQNDFYVNGEKVNRYQTSSQSITLEEDKPTITIKNTSDDSLYSIYLTITCTENIYGGITEGSGTQASPYVIENTHSGMFEAGASQTFYKVTVLEHYKMLVEALEGTVTVDGAAIVSSGYGVGEHNISAAAGARFNVTFEVTERIYKIGEYELGKMTETSIITFEIDEPIYNIYSLTAYQQLNGYRYSASGVQFIIGGMTESYDTTFELTESNRKAISVKISKYYEYENVVIVIGFVANAYGEVTGGSGTLGNPYVIDTDNLGVYGGAQAAFYKVTIPEGKVMKITTKTGTVTVDSAAVAEAGYAAGVHTIYAAADAYFEVAIKSNSGADIELNEPFLVNSISDGYDNDGNAKYVEFTFVGEANKTYHIEIIPNGWPSFGVIINNNYYGATDDWSVSKSYYKGDVITDNDGKFVIQIQSMETDYKYTITITEA